MAGFGNYAPGKGPPPTRGVFRADSPGEKKQPGVSYPCPEFSEEMGSSICDRLENGESLNQVERIIGMPSRRTIRRWRTNYPEFDQAVKLAIEDGNDVLAQEARRLASEALTSERITLDADGKVIQTVRYDNVERSKLAAGQINWELAKRDKRYSDKIQQEHVGENGGPLKLIVERIEVIARPDQNKTAT
jgi:transposase-like protein